MHHYSSLLARLARTVPGLPLAAQHILATRPDVSKDFANNPDIAEEVWLSYWKTPKLHYLAARALAARSLNSTQLSILFRSARHAGVITKALSYNKADASLLDNLAGREVSHEIAEILFRHFASSPQDLLVLKAQLLPSDADHLETLLSLPAKPPARIYLKHRNTSRTTAKRPKDEAAAGETPFAELVCKRPWTAGWCLANTLGEDTLCWEMLFSLIEDGHHTLPLADITALARQLAAA